MIPLEPTRAERVLVEPRFHFSGTSLTVEFICQCGEATDAIDVRFDAGHAIRYHLAARHSEAVGFGLCTQCGMLTDYFRATMAEGTLWGCERCAPAPAELDGQR